MTTYAIAYDPESETWDVLADGVYAEGFDTRAEAAEAAVELRLDDDRERAAELLAGADAAMVARVLAMLGG